MDLALVEKHLVHIVESVDLLQRLGEPEQLEKDPVQFGFVVHTLQTAVQAAIDTAAIIVSERRLGEPATNREMFAKLAQDGWLGSPEADTWRRIVAFRNIVVHRYLQVDPRIVRAVVETHLEDLLAFARCVRDRLAKLGK
ncbi:MAG: DUF86 domain-containing protein [Planctomycetota bacterium]